MPIRPLKILAVDDDFTHRLILSGMIAKYGHQTVLAEDGLDAVERFKQEQPDIVLMDIMMPNMNGYDATRQIKTLAGDRFVPVIVLTAMEDPKALASCVEAGADDFLVKPYNPIILKSKLDALVRIRDMVDTIERQREKLQNYISQFNQEQQVALDVYHKMLDRNLTDFHNIETLSCPSSSFSGDIVLTCPSPTGSIHLLVGDFTGHGLSAAIGALPTADLFYAMSAKGFDLSHILLALNEKLTSALPVFIFLSAMLVEIDNDQLTVYNCGMPDGLVLDAEGKVRQRLASRHLPIGISSGKAFQPVAETIQLAPGEHFCVYSDGVTEAADPDGNMFGQQRLEDCLARKNPIAVLKATLDEFHGGNQPRDDITIVNICSGS